MRLLQGAGPADRAQAAARYKRTVYGAGTSLHGRHVTALIPFKWVEGLEAFRESTDYLYYDGLAQRQRGALGVKSQ